MGDELRWDGEHAPARPPKANMSASAQHSVVDEVVFGRDYDYSKLVRARAHARTHKTSRCARTMHMLCTRTCSRAALQPCLPEAPSAATEPSCACPRSW